MKTFNLILLFSLFMFFSCSPSKENDDNSEDLKQECDVTNPLIELQWLKKIIDEFEDEAATVYNPHARIYQCTYKYGIGFLLEMCLECPDAKYSFRNYEGDILCVCRGLSEEDRCAELDIDYENKKLIWEKWYDYMWCEDRLFYYFGGEKMRQTLVNDWLVVGFYQHTTDAEIVNFINQTGIFKPVDASDIWYHARQEVDYHLIFVNTKEQKRCSQLKDIIILLQKFSIVAYVNLTFEFYPEFGGIRYNIGSYSHYFYVQVKDPKDLTDLYAVMRETNTWFFRPSSIYAFFLLCCDKYSMGNAMQMSQYFYETGKFVAAEPDIISAKVNR